MTAIAALALLASPRMAHALPVEIVTELGDARLLGASRYQVLAWQVFDAELWSRGAHFSWDEPFALSLVYHRNFEADVLVSRSLSGMAERSSLASRESLAVRLRPCFADVRAGDRFTGVSLTPDTARFYFNGRRTCDVSWPGFRRAFFGIWLDARGADRAFSARLVGR
ncbi:MAG: chalcone isomerase family protein [Pseudomonadota bacterium]